MKQLQIKGSPSCAQPQLPWLCCAASWHSPCHSKPSTVGGKHFYCFSCCKYPETQCNSIYFLSFTLLTGLQCTTKRRLISMVFYFHFEKQLGFDYLSFSKGDISEESSNSSEMNKSALSNWAVQALKISVEAI